MKFRIGTLRIDFESLEIEHIDYYGIAADGCVQDSCLAWVYSKPDHGRIAALEK
jgi:hypothetical protein